MATQWQWQVKHPFTIPPTTSPANASPHGRVRRQPCKRTGCHKTPYKPRMASTHERRSKIGKVWRDRRLPQKLRTELYEALILSILLYNAEAWVLPNAAKKKIESFHGLQLIFWRQLDMDIVVFKTHFLWTKNRVSCKGCYRTFRNQD